MPATPTPAIPAEFQSLRDTLPPLLIMEEVAKLFRCCPNTVDRMVKDGSFPAPIKIGGAIKRFARDSVLEYLANNHSREPHAARTRKASRPSPENLRSSASPRKASRKKGRAAK